MLITRDNARHFQKLATEARNRKRAEHDRALLAADHLCQASPSLWLDRIGVQSQALHDLLLRMLAACPGPTERAETRVKNLLACQKLLAETRAILAADPMARNGVGRPAQIRPLNEAQEPAKIGQTMDPDTTIPSDPIGLD